MLTPERKLQGAEVQQLVVMKEEPPEQQEWSSSLQQEDSEPPHIKEEQEELWSSQEGEQLQGLEEAETTKFTFTPVPVKSEDDEEKPQSSQLHHRQREQMETGADGLDSGGPGTHSDPHPETYSGHEIEVKLEDSSEAETEDSEDWEESRESGLDSVDSEEGLKGGSEFGETFSSEEGEKLFSCSHCGRTFNNKGNLTRHMTVHTVEKPYGCPECGKGFTQKSNLSLHLAQHRGKPFGCSDCEETFPNYSLLVTHMRVHRGLKRFVCPVCGKEWRSSSKLKDHLRVHTAEKPYSCSHCGRRYSSPSQVNSHRCVTKSLHLIQTGFQSQDHQGSEPEEDSDPDPGDETDLRVRPADGAEGGFCKKSRKCQSAVTYQRKQKVSGEEDWYPDSELVPFKPLEVKTEPETHQRDRTDLCSQSKPPTDPDLLQDEDQRESGAVTPQDPPEGPETGLERPLTEYSAEKQHRVNICESSKPPKTQTRRPLRAKRLLSCPQCGGGFAQEQDLLVHMRIHIKEHLFSCSLCGLRFATRDSLTSHMSSHAVGEPSCCSLCDAGSTRGECEHMRGAAQQTRFHCSCGEEFAWRRHLTRHMEGHKLGDTKFSYHRCSKGPPKTQQATNQDSAEPETRDREEAFMDFQGPEAVSNMKHVLRPESDQRSDHQEAPRGAEQEDPEPRVIKEEQEEVWISQAETTKFTFTPVPVKSEDDEEKPQSSQLHHRQREQMETGADGLDSGGPGPEGNRPWLLYERGETSDSLSGSRALRGTSVWADEVSERVETKSEDSVDSDFWKEGNDPRKLNALMNEDASKSSKGNKIYICFQCGGRFYVLGDLRSHEKRVHRMKEKKKRTFPCSVCGHVCPYLSHLKIHMRRHTGEKPFICQKCGKKYAQKENLRLHLLKHAREDTEST